jgi:GWxTD domain-containing protein
MRTIPPEREMAVRRIVLGALGLLVFVAGLTAVAGCLTYNTAHKLSSAHSDFLAKVNYIMTKQERKVFLDLPESSRDNFIAEFWKRRDPDPDTEPNEFRIEYEARVSRSGVLFHGEGRPGWQTDRGRIYILFGPPTERMTYPMDPNEYCREVWYYGAFPVIFVDEHCTGYYVLTPINLEHLQELNIAQGYFQKTITQEKKLFDYEVSMEGKLTEGNVYEGKVFVDIPYNSIWFSFKGGRLETSFEVQLELSEQSGTTVWKGQGTFPLTLEDKDLIEKWTDRFRMEFAIRIDKDIDRLKSQKLRMDVSVESSTEGDGVKKVVMFELES